MRIFSSKKGVEVWISWVLLMAFSVALGVMMHDFMTGYTTAATENIKERVYDTEDCESVALSIDEICQNTQNLYINLTNRRDIAVDKIMVRLYDVYYNPETASVNMSVDLGVDSTKQVIVLKQGEVKKVAKLEVVPIIIKDEFEIICDEKKGIVDTIPDCTDTVKRFM